MASLWKLDGDGDFVGGVEFGPFQGWFPNTLAVENTGDAYLLWNNVNGAISLWGLDPSGEFQGGVEYGPY
jgi:hypothetical protein